MLCCVFYLYLGYFVLVHVRVFFPYQFLPFLLLITAVLLYCVMYVNETSRAGRLVSKKMWVSKFDSKVWV